jgi:hypothetical protein
VKAIDLQKEPGKNTDTEMKDKQILGQRLGNIFTQGVKICVHLRIL